MRGPPLTNRPRRASRAYSLIEVLVTVLIIQMISGMVVVNVGAVTSSERLTRASQQVIVALRYARMLAMSSGQTTGVEFDSSTSKIRVFQGSSATTVSSTLMPGGTYVIDMTKQADISGVTISSALISGDTSNPYRVVFGTLGATTNNGYVTLAYGGQTKTVQIPMVGDAKAP